MVGKYAIPDCVSGQIFYSFYGCAAQACTALRVPPAKRYGKLRYAQTSTIIFVTYSATKKEPLRKRVRAATLIQRQNVRETTLIQRQSVRASTLIQRQNVRETTLIQRQSVKASTSNNQKKEP